MARLINTKKIVVLILFLSIVDSFGQTQNHLFYTSKDSVLINEDLKIYVTKEEYNSTIDSCPEFVDEYITSPDNMYNRKDSTLEFGSEVGQDSYYLYYAHFLQMKYEEEDYTEVRKNLSSIYYDLNYIFKELNQGGTFYGHMGARIPSYVEYSVYLYHLTKEDFTVHNNINAQKKKFINLLKQTVRDRIKDDGNINSKKVLRKDLIQSINQIEKRITNSFYLSQTHIFYVNNYIYW